MSRIDAALRRARAARAATPGHGDRAIGWQNTTPAEEPSSRDLHLLPSEAVAGDVRAEHAVSSRPIQWPIAKRPEPPIPSARSQSIARAATPVTPPFPADEEPGASVEPGRRGSAPGAPLNADAMFEALDQVLTQSPLVSQRRAPRPGSGTDQ
jgi:hypothetical protein